MQREGIQPVSSHLDAAIKLVSLKPSNNTVYQLIFGAALTHVHSHGRMDFDHPGDTDQQIATHGGDVVRHFKVEYTLCGSRTKSVK